MAFHAYRPYGQADAGRRVTGVEHPFFMAIPNRKYLYSIDARANSAKQRFVAAFELVARGASLNC
jgi:hypothetical protein